MGKSEEALTLPEGIATIGALMAWLAKRDDAFANTKLVRAAVNQDFATPETTVQDGDEIAFFPPVTGG